jgi:hypothetical protein
MYKIIFSYAGYENAFNVVNEVKVRHSKTLPVSAADDVEPNKNAQVERASELARSGDTICARQRRLLFGRFEDRNSQIQGRSR